jgi:hypothetical protein
VLEPDKIQLVQPCPWNDGKNYTPLLGRYDFQRSVLAVESRERERDVEVVDWEVRMRGRESIDVIVESEVV